MDAWLEQQSMKEESVTGPDGKAYTALAHRRGQALHLTCLACLFNLMQSYTFT
jgi:hypothetical protein